MRAAMKAPAAALPTPIPAAAPGAIKLLGVGLGVLGEFTVGIVRLGVDVTDEALSSGSLVELKPVDVSGRVDEGSVDAVLGIVVTVVGSEVSRVDGGSVDVGNGLSVAK